MAGPSHDNGVVLWFEDTAGFVHRTDGRAAWGDFVIELDHVQFLSLPSAFASYPLGHWSDAELDAYAWYAGQFSVGDQLAGWSGGFDIDPRIDAALNEADLSYGQWAELSPPGVSWRDRHDTLAAETDVERWASLLELSLAPSENGSGMWGDAGDVRWLIRRDDAEHRDFSSTRRDMTS